MKPLVSIVIPCYNCEKYIGQAIESCLNQTYSNIEILVVDDGSIDSSKSIALEFCDLFLERQIHVISHPGNINRGVSSSRLLGVSVSRGDLIAFLDADDVFHPKKIEYQVNIMISLPEVVLSHTAINILGESSEAKKHEYHFNSSPLHPYSFRSLPDFLFRLHICNSSVLVWKWALEGLNWSAPMLFQREDWLLWTLLSSRGKFIQLPDVLTSYRIHDFSYTCLRKASKTHDYFARIEFLLVLSAKVMPSILSLRSLFLAFRSFIGLWNLYRELCAPTTATAP